jgi:putative FmdB family regulatory protein
MPVYTYRCENCGVQFERTQKFSEQALTRCPECGKKTLHKVYTPVGVVFKGSGFYATDHRSPSGMGLSNRSEEKQADSTPAAAKKTESDGKTNKTETTPAPAPNTKPSTTSDKE